MTAPGDNLIVFFKLKFSRKKLQVVANCSNMGIVNTALKPRSPARGILTLKTLGHSDFHSLISILENSSVQRDSTSEKYWRKREWRHACLPTKP